MFPMSSSSPSNSSADTGLMKLRKRKEPTSTKIIFDIFPLLGLAACKVLVSTDRTSNTCYRYCQPQLLSRNLTPGTGSNCQLISKVFWAEFICVFLSHISRRELGLPSPRVFVFVYVFVFVFMYFWATFLDTWVGVTSSLATFSEA